MFAVALVADRRGDRPDVDHDGRRHACRRRRSALIVLMIIGCFAVGGGLMFLIFYSARKGYDDAVHHGVRLARPGPELRLPAALA